MSKIPRGSRRTLTPSEVLELSARFGTEWYRAGSQIWAVAPQHSERTRPGGCIQAPAQIVHFVWMEYLYNGEPVLQIIQDTRPESESRLGVAYTDAGRKLAAARRSWQRLLGRRR